MSFTAMKYQFSDNTLIAFFFGSIPKRYRRRELLRFKAKEVPNPLFNISNVRQASQPFLYENSLGHYTGHMRGTILTIVGDDWWYS